MNYKFFCLGALVILLLSALTVSASATPTLNFTSPTQENGTIIGVNSSQVNISITEPDLDTFMFDWNGTNYSIYDNSLVLALNFNNNSGIGESYNDSDGALVIDSSKYNNDGTMHVGDAGSGNYTSGRFGGSYNFDGSDDYITIPDSPSLSGFEDKFTLEFWIKAGTQESWHAPLCKLGSFMAEFTTTPMEMHFYIRTATGGDIYFPAYTLTSGAWTYVAYTYDGSAARTYVNDELINDWGYSGSINVSDSPLVIGSKDQWWGYYNGSLDEVRIYKRSLTPQEIWLHYQSEFQKYNGTTYMFYASLTDLADGTYTYYGWANDSSGNSNYTDAYTASNPRYLTVSQNPDNDVPVLNFLDPTEENGSTIERSWAQMNISINESNLDTFVFDWNGTNYSIYDSSLVLALNLDNNSALGENETDAVDLSKHGNDCSIHGDAVWNSSGRSGGAYQFDGTDDYADCGNAGSLNVGSALTIEGWFILRHSSNKQDFVNKQDWDNKKGYIFSFISDDKIELYLGNGVAYTGLWSDPLPLGTWTHIAATWNGSLMRLYVNGADIGWNQSFAGPIAYGSEQLVLGRASLWGGEYFNGTMDEVRIYDRALAADEVSLHYQSEFQKYNSSTYLFYTNLTNLTDGTYTYYGWANDTAGNVG